MTGKQKYALILAFIYLVAGCFLCGLTSFSLGGSALICISIIVAVTGLEVDAKRKPTG